VLRFRGFQNITLADVMGMREVKRPYNVFSKRSRVSPAQWFARDIIETDVNVLKDIPRVLDLIDRSRYYPVPPKSLASIFDTWFWSQPLEIAK